MLMRRIIHELPILAVMATLPMGCESSSPKAPGSESYRTPDQSNLFSPCAPYLFSNLQSRSVTQENPTGGKGIACKERGCGNARKGAPAFCNVQPGETKVLCDIEGPGMVRHIWMTVQDRSPEMMRSSILRMYWDGSDHPSVEAPVGDFFGVAHGRTVHFMSPWVGMPQGSGFHCYFPMPFSRRCRITFENDSPNLMPYLFYQVDYTLGDPVDENWGRFHTHFRRENPCPVSVDYTLLDTQGSPGVFVGAVIGVNPKAPGWWGEGEMKFYIDGDETFPTIAGTGTEDYICAGWGLEVHDAIYTGMNYRAKKPGFGDQFCSFYRFHFRDPIYFQHGLRVELQQLGASGGNRAKMKKYGWKGPHIHPNYRSWLCDRSDDYCSVAYWYQRVLDKPLPPLPSREERIKDIALQAWEQAD